MEERISERLFPRQCGEVNHEFSIHYLLHKEMFWRWVQGCNLVFAQVPSRADVTLQAVLEILISAASAKFYQLFRMIFLGVDSFADHHQTLVSGLRRDIRVGGEDINNELVLRVLLKLRR